MMGRFLAKLSSFLRRLRFIRDSSARPKGGTDNEDSNRASAGSSSKADSKAPPKPGFGNLFSRLTRNQIEKPTGVSTKEATNVYTDATINNVNWHAGIGAVVAPAVKTERNPNKFEMTLSYNIHSHYNGQDTTQAEIYAATVILRYLLHKIRDNRIFIKTDSMNFVKSIEAYKDANSGTYEMQAANLCALAERFTNGVHFDWIGNDEELKNRQADLLARLGAGCKPRNKTKMRPKSDDVKIEIPYNPLTAQTPIQYPFPEDCIVGLLEDNEFVDEMDRHPGPINQLELLKNSKLAVIYSP